jgi:hypothetical protein
MATLRQAWRDKGFCVYRRVGTGMTTVLSHAVRASDKMEKQPRLPSPNFAGRWLRPLPRQRALSSAVQSSGRGGTRFCINA